MKTGRDGQTGFERARPEIECVDVWPPRTCTREAMLAYKALAAAGRLRLRMPVQISKHTGRVVIRYDSDIPHEWILKELKALKEGFEAAGEQQAMEIPEAGGASEIWNI